MELLGTNDIATLLGVNRSRAHQIVNTKGFPDPVATVNKRTNIWTRDQVLGWATEHRYDIVPAPRP